ncbi:MAG: hypothetical protein IJ799_04480 [Bacteroidales bacterium]|nr:hypothetical protein [Bacteroidales bacterium]
MPGKRNIFESEYVIDGARMDLTPGEMLRGCMREAPATQSAGEWEPVIDESIDPAPGIAAYEPSRISRYLSLTRQAAREFPSFFAGPYTRIRLLRSLADVLWHKGKFRLEDLSLKACWKWKDGRLGDMASFYDSVSQTVDCLDGLSLDLHSYRCAAPEGCNEVVFTPVLSGESQLDLFGEELGPDSPKMGSRHICKQVLDPDPDSWIAYVPFDTSEFRLGGSLLAQVTGNHGSGSAPQAADPDYFEDCFEVVRELVEDGILLSGATVGDGGLLTSLDRMTGDSAGAQIDVSDILRAYPGSDMVHVLFSEVPGVLIQARDSDFDYLDAEFLLQDIAWFPIGHPMPKGRKVSVVRPSASGIQNILESLISR